MIIGEQIYSNLTNITYTVFQTLRSSGQAECAYATSDKDKKTFFIKRLLNIRYSNVGVSATRCKVFEKNRQRVYQGINKRTIPGGACSYVNDFFREKTFYYIVTEKIDAIEFNISQLSKMMSIEDKLFLFRIVAYSFLPLEEANIIYADVKPENILIKSNGNQHVAKLIDFESAFHIDTPPEKGYIVGTEPYYSPELAEYNMEDNAIDASILSTKSDIFSLGIILYEFLTGKYPAPKEYGKYAFEFIKEGGSVINCKHWSPELCLHINRMLSLDPKERPNIKELLVKLKELVDVSLAPEHVSIPSIILRRENDKLAYVSLMSLNNNAHISYNTDNMGWIAYTKPFTLCDDDVQLDVKVSLSTMDGKLEEKIFSYLVSVSTNRRTKLARPIINIIDRKVKIECSNSEAIVHYTLDGSIPDKTSSIYEKAFPIGDNITIKAYARCVGFLSSDVSSINSSSKIFAS